MLDIHPPEHGIHGVRDFLLHLFTITIGLLIAISLEQSVEAIHHRHQRREAEETIRQELRENRDTLTTARSVMTGEQKNLVLILDFLQARLQNRNADAKGLNLQFREGALQDAAWRTANTTGVTTYMDYESRRIWTTRRFKHSPSPTRSRRNLKRWSSVPCSST